MKNNKQVLRQQAIQITKALSEHQLMVINQTLIAKVCQFLVSNNFKTIGIYVSFGWEAPTHSIIEFALEKNLKVYVPKVDDTTTMTFYEINSLTQLVPSQKYQFLEPNTNPAKVLKKANELDVLFVPLAVFDKTLQRIGTGFGYYDRWIAKNKFQGLKVGIARQLSFTKTLIITNEYDVPLDYVITEDYVYGW